MSKDGGPAFPVSVDRPLATYSYAGMTLRDAFAIAALQGIISQNPPSCAPMMDMATHIRDGAHEAAAAYAWADAMLAEREKGRT